MYSRCPGAQHVDIARGGLRKIDDASVTERTAIVDAHVDALPVFEICHLHPCRKGKLAMRGGEFLHVVNFSRGRATPVIGDSIPAGNAGLTRADARGCDRNLRACRVTRATRAHQQNRGGDRETLMNRPRKDVRAHRFV